MIWMTELPFVIKMAGDGLRSIGIFHSITKSVPATAPVTNPG